MDLICPICGSKLNTFDKSLVCSGHHCFDIARQGYVNLLTVQQKHSLHPGDTREQVLSRRAFLEAGYYAPIAEALIAVAKELTVNSNEIRPSGELLDVGCGEGYYSARLAGALGMRLPGGCPLCRRKIQERPVALRHRVPHSRGRPFMPLAHQSVCPDHAGGIQACSAAGGILFSGSGGGRPSAWTEIHHLRPSY